MGSGHGACRSIDDCQCSRSARHPCKSLSFERSMYVSKKHAEHLVQARPSMGQRWCLLSNHAASELSTVLAVYTVAIEDCSKKPVLAHRNDNVCVLIDPLLAL